MNPLGRQVRHLREERDWTQVQLAVQASVSPTVVNQVETGKRNPSARTLEKIAQALGVEVRELFPLEQASLPLEEHQAERRSWPLADMMLTHYDRKFSEFEERAVRIEGGEGVAGGPLGLFFDVEKETAAAEASIGRAYPDEITRLMRRGLPIMESMLENYLGLKEQVDEDLEQLMTERLDAQRAAAS